MPSNLTVGVNIGASAGLVNDPSALPPGAIAFANIRDGNYYYGDNMLSDVFVENSDWSDFSPDSIVVPIGLWSIAGANDPTLGPDLSAEMLTNGFTAIVTAYLNGQMDASAVELPGFSFEADWRASSTSNCRVVSNATTQIYSAALPQSMHKFAMRYDPATGIASLCIDGGAVVSADDGGPLEGLNSVCFSSSFVFSELVIYPLKSDAEMQALCDLDTASLPENTVEPAITGTAQVGQTLTCDDGEWSNGGVVYSKQWVVGGVLKSSGDTYQCQPEDEEIGRAHV